MKALILAAGRGSRMKTLTQDQPKCMTRLGGAPLLHWQLRALRNAGLGPVGIVTGYLAERLSAHGDHRFHNPRWAQTNMVATLTCAGSWLAAGPVIISYADIFYPAETVRRLAAAEADIAVSYDPDWLQLWQRRFAEPLSDAESFAVDADGYLVDIGRRIEDVKQAVGQYMGLVRLTPAGWAQVDATLQRLPPAEMDRLDMTGLLQRMLREGTRIRTVPHTGLWGEVDSADDLAFYQSLVDGGALDLDRLTATVPA